jgi:FAD/FMN-containing dehydrogenase
MQRGVDIDEVKGTAEVLAGTQMIEIYAAFDQKGYLFPGFVTLHEITALTLLKVEHVLQ